MTLLYTDRTRIERGFSCPRRRWYEFHEGGIGIQPERGGIAKTVGSWTHKGVEHILGAAFHSGELPDRELTREVLAQTVKGFRAEVEEKGAEEATNKAQLLYLMDEQSCLVEGLGWIAYRVFVPWLLENYELLGVEDEFSWVTACNCGLEGAGEWTDHRDRGCDGLVIPVKQDVVARNKQSGRIEVFDWKTSSYGADYSDAEHMLQMLIACRGISWKYDEEVALHWIVNLKKGKIDRAQEQGELNRQNSPLCYAYFKAPDPPFEAFEISVKYTNRKGFNRTPLWRVLDELKEKEMSGMEWWVMEHLSEDACRALVEPVGPATRYPAEHEIGVLQEVYGQEQVYRGYETDGMLEDLPLRTWNCRPYGQYYPCPYLGLCLGRELPTDSHWVKREPHHGIEKEVREI